jgi:dCTP diphosphatase
MGASESRLEVDELQRRLGEFAAARDWGQFHTPKNLATAAAVEAAELLEVFQWLTPAESASLDGRQLEAARREIADVVIYLLRLADVLGIDLGRAIYEKIEENESRYPVETSKGSAAKADRK